MKVVAKMATTTKPAKPSRGATFASLADSKAAVDAAAVTALVKMHVAAGRNPEGLQAIGDAEAENQRLRLEFMIRARPTLPASAQYALPSEYDARAILQQTEDAHPVRAEVLDAHWLPAPTPGTPYAKPNVPGGSITTDAVGNVTSAPPNILVPQNIGFYAA